MNLAERNIIITAIHHVCWWGLFSGQYPFLMQVIEVGYRAPMWVREAQPPIQVVEDSAIVSM